MTTCGHDPRQHVVQFRDCPSYLRSRIAELEGREVVWHDMEQKYAEAVKRLAHLEQYPGDCERVHCACPPGYVEDLQRTQDALRELVLQVAARAQRVLGVRLLPGPIPGDFDPQQEYDDRMQRAEEDEQRYSGSEGR